MGYREWTKGGSICEANCSAMLVPIVLLTRDRRLAGPVLQKKAGGGVVGAAASGGGGASESVGLSSESNALGLIKAVIRLPRENEYCTFQAKQVRLIFEFIYVIKY